MRYPAITVAAAVSSAAMAFAAPAAATDAKRSRVEVSYTDLNLSTEAGRQELSSRFDRAARQLCGVQEDGAGPRSARDCHKRMSRLLGQQAAAILERHQASGG